jgi:hypothetical protein
MWEWMYRLKVSGQLHAPTALLPGKGPGIYWIGGWVGRIIDLNNVERRKILAFLGLEIRSLGSAARNQSLYRLRYYGSLINI